MNHPTCPQSSLVEALRDGRLGAPERASVERHLSSCRACAALCRDLARIGAAVAGEGTSPTQLEHQRARQALLRRAAGEPAVSRRPPWVWALGACLLVLVPASVWTFTKTPTPVAKSHTVQTAEPRLTPSPAARYERERIGTEDHVTLTEGTIDLRAIDDDGPRLTVKTTDATILAGTASLCVEAEHGKLVALSVREGEVKLIQADVAVVIPAGGSWSASRAVAAMGPSSAPTAPSASLPVASDPKPVARTHERPTVVSTARAPSTAIASTAAVAPVVPSGSASASASRAFADAMDAVARGDFSRGADRLDAFSTAHPDDARADDAEYLKAIALARAGRADDAAAAARRYLATRPRGAHRAQVQKLVSP